MAATLTPDVLRPVGPRRRLRALRAAATRSSVPRVPAPAPEPRKRPLTSAVLAAGTMGLLGGLVLAFFGYLVVGSALQAERQQDVMYQRLRADLKAMTVPFAGASRRGRRSGVLTIPAIDLEQVVVAGSSAEQTRTGPGLKTDSVLPGQAGLSVLVGHRSTLGAAFADLDELAPGDVIEVTTGQGRFVYDVDLVRTSDAPPRRSRSSRRG